MVGPGSQMDKNGLAIRTESDAVQLVVEEAGFTGVGRCLGQHRPGAGAGWAVQDAFGNRGDSVIRHIAVAGQVDGPGGIDGYSCSGGDLMIAPVIDQHTGGTIGDGG